MFAYMSRNVKSCEHQAVAMLALLVIAALLAAGCGEDEEPTGGNAETTASEDIPGDADPEAKRVIGAWVDALRGGDVEEAASYFAIPSVAENGPILVRIRTEDDAIAFNESLPCGAELIHAEGEGDFTTATFRLTERPGPGRCGSGTGETASTAFVIRDGKIVEWRRVGLQIPGAPGQSA
jgi:limonene-1,2-epoxide hydrolase